jgi:hypothetical protein
MVQKKKKGVGGGNSHQRAMARLEVAKGDTPNLGSKSEEGTVMEFRESSTKIDTGLLIGIFGVILAVLIPLLQWNGVVTVRWWLSAFIYLSLIAVSGWAFGRWEVARRWSATRRGTCASLLVLILTAISVFGVVTQFRREHPVTATVTKEDKAASPEPFVSPPVVASDAETLPNVDVTKRPLIWGHIGVSLTFT